MKRFSILLLSVAILVVYLAACKKPFEAGIETTVKGIAFDRNKNQPVPNAGIFIREYKPGSRRQRYEAIIDSTRTGPDGRYTITFTTTGKGTLYSVVFEPEANYHTTDSPAPIEPGGEKTLDFFAYETHILKARIQVVDNPNPPLGVSTHWGSEVKIYGRKNDTVVLLIVFPNQNNMIGFSIVNVDTPQIYNVQRDTMFFQGFADTFTHTFRVEPGRFRLRG